MEKIVIKDCGEPLVDLRTACPNVRLDLEPARRTEGSIFVRKAVAEMLNSASKSLPKNISFIVADGWRPNKAQKRYHKYFVRKLRKENPSWREKKIITEATKLCPPSINLKKPGHASGGAIDIELCKNGRRLHFSTTKLPLAEAVRSSQKDLPEKILENRKLLSDVLANVGFVNNPKEYWHWSYGDYRWAEKLGKKETLYGSIDIEGKRLIR